MDKLLDLFFPKFCLGCQAEGYYLCQDCRALLDIVEHQYCLCETKPLRLSSDSKTGKCQRCQDKKLSGLYFALSYKEKSLTKKLIHQFKYKPYIKRLAKPLASILIEHFIKTGKNTDKIWENGVLIPVPLNQKKLRERGYNQSEELAKELSKIIKIPVFTDVLIKTKSTPSQMELKKEKRQKNLLGAFSINSPDTGSQENLFGDKKVFLVDDVYTTGSTMQECANVLRTSGAKSVWGICIAREG
ncbi:MAG: ComF family protein [Candidatus Staskawiczbacteria bacterium]|nr:ComF family protein [Candidatus Staskawiczbacteria bacterium]